MSDDLYRILTLGVQALRRNAEALTLAVGGALGVAADPYPHQLATVRRILTDTRVRHLIADEVGLGKTVQALMVLNALRWQNPRHKAVILVPDRLVRQWQNECWTRCHCQAAVVGNEHEENTTDSFVRIVRPQSIQSGLFKVDPARFDLLIVDEPQTLPSDVMEVVEREARDFRQVLMLSATPGLGDPARRRQMLMIIEPERSLAAELSDENSEEVFASLEEGALNRLSEAGHNPLLAAAMFQTFSTERRIARARRADWSRYLPERAYAQVVVEPLHGEAQRVRMGLQWMTQSEGGRADSWRFAQALHRSHQSARQAINARLRRGEEGGSLSAAVEASAESPGDSRFDALLDVLTEVWVEDPVAQVVIVAGDNPTIDFLSTRLPRYFGTEDDPLVISELRRSTESLEDETEDVRAMYEQLQPFSEGDARILLIGEWVQAGLNLHYFANNVVFYSSPWTPEPVDQLIGRLDRLRPNGLFHGDRLDRFAFPRVRIWSIAQRGTVESRVMTGLETVGVFRRPLPPVAPSEAAEMHHALEELAFGHARAAAVEKLRGLAAQWDGGWERSRLAHLSPYTPETAKAAYDTLQAASLPAPVLGRDRRPDRPFTARAEDGLRGWMDAMLTGRFFDIRGRKDCKDENIRFSTIWYTEKAETGPFPVREFQGKRWMDGHVPFLYRRRDLSTLPRNFVHTDEGEPEGRLLHFFDHGDPVHDQLLHGFADLILKRLNSNGGAASVVVHFPEGHPALILQGQTLMVSVAWVDPGRSAISPFDPARLKDVVDRAPTEAQRAALTADIALAEDAWRCDQRWLRERLPALLLFDVAQLVGQHWNPIKRDLALAVLQPVYYGDQMICAKSRHGMASVALNSANEGLKEQAHRMAAELTARWSAPLLSLKEELPYRLLQVDAEYRDQETLRYAEIEKRKAANVGAQERLREGQIAAVERRLEMAEAVKAARTSWLSAIPQQAISAKPRKVGTLILRPAPLAAI